ncbi:ABC transporter ATP-binding protein [Paenibacillus aurantius]|uniref:ABC transporter ATP-binding protein n=1 Tax=Paenibacillus aurantius TaxID=2918900 RepID=A0AA96LAN6_9BACL|nr:ABC transporter ATP-binding protein [Paenibacillus aurantius]WNQ09653.1 ABC transporter ATP-binding protein [Paenibacillus aurantius]
MKDIGEDLNSSPSKLLIYSWIISFIKPYWRTLALLVLCGIIVGGIEVVIPKFIQYFIDSILPQNNTGLYIKLLMGLALLIVIMIVFMSVRNMLERQLREKAAKDLQFKVFQHLRFLGYPYFENTSIGENVTLMNTDVTAVQDIYRKFLPGVLWRSLFALVSLGIMFSMNAILTIITLASFILYYFVGPVLEKKVAKVNKVASDTLGVYEKHIYDSVVSVTEVRAFYSQNWILRQYHDKYNNYAKQWLRRSTYIYTSESLRYLSFNIGAVALFSYGIVLVQSGSLMIGEFIAFILYFFSVLGILANVVSDITQQKILMIQGERLYKFCSQNPMIHNIKTPVHVSHIEGQIDFENVSFHYPTKAGILNQLNLRILSGEKVAIVGFSGGGKSSLLKLINRFYDTSSGVIKLDGIPIKNLDIGQLRESIGYVFQENYLFSSSIKENIRFGNPEASDEQVINAAKAAFIHDSILSLPEGYDTFVGDRGNRLSGGQKQRIAIARMLVKDPKIVLLDEATSALDQVTEREVQFALANLLKGRTTIAIAHRLSTIRDYDRILFMDKGSIIEMGTWEELVGKKGAFYRLLKGTELDERNCV